MFNLPSKRILDELYEYGSVSTSRWDYFLYREPYLSGYDIIQRISRNGRIVDQRLVKSRLV